MKKRYLKHHSRSTRSQPVAVPPGAIIAYGSTQSIPVGWLLCNGQDCNVNDYPDLYHAIGTRWGGNGDPFFKVPNLHGLFLRATASREGVGETGGTVTGKTDRAYMMDFNEDYEGQPGGNNSRRVPGLAHYHEFDTAPPFMGFYYIIKG